MLKCKTVPRVSNAPIVIYTGLVNPLLVSVPAGDRISGKVTRSEIASLVASASSLPSAGNKTFEVRRDESVDAKGKEMTPRDTLRLFLGLVEDRHRVRVGLNPFPMPAKAPAPVTDERKKVRKMDLSVWLADGGHQRWCCC